MLVHVAIWNETIIAKLLKSYAWLLYKHSHEMVEWMLKITKICTKSFFAYASPFQFTLQRFYSATTLIRKLLFKHFI